jgi:hypothetical protein
MWCNIIETSFSSFPFGFFFFNMGAISDEHGERFHHDISQIEERYRGKWSPYILADHCWSLISETPTGENKRRKKKM